jgi:hypothetical protein
MAWRKSALVTEETRHFDAYHICENGYSRPAASHASSALREVIGA